MVTGGWHDGAYDVARRQRMGDPIDVGDVSVDLRPDGMRDRGRTLGHAGHHVVESRPETMTDAACHIAGRNLSHPEWDTYIGDLAPYHTRPARSIPVPDRT